MSYFESLTLNGVIYSGENLNKLVNEKGDSAGLNEHEKSLYKFIEEWISPVDKISVKTSGTTGKPKVIAFTKTQAIASAKMTCDYFWLDKNTNALLSLSTEFIGGKMMVVRAFVSGMNLITVEPGGNPLEEMSQKIDFASMVPLQVQNSLQKEETKKKFLTIPNVIIGGAPVSPALEREIAEYPNHIYSTFAMTETLSHIALKRLSGKGKKDYYETLPGVSIAIDKRGCLKINAPLLNEQTIITNDVVDIVNPTHFRWLGRYDNVINSGGIKIHPEIVESKLAPFSPDHRFFITSLPDEKLGQKVIMLIEGGGDLDISNIKNWAEKILSRYEIPKEYFVIDKFLETAAGKIKKEETLKISVKD